MKQPKWLKKNTREEEEEVTDTKLSGNPVFIVAARRTPIGRFQGGLSQMSAPELGSRAIAAALKTAGIEPAAVDEVIMGNVLTAGIGQAPARQAALGAGVPVSVPATTIGKVCGSGLKSVIAAVQAIRLGDASVCVAGGQESMSQSPYLMPGVRAGLRMGHRQFMDSMILDGLWDPYGDKHMGNCAELCARKYSFSREAQDAFALRSYERAQQAWSTGAFNEEVVPVEVRQGKENMMIDRDEEPDMAQPDKVPTLRPAFEKDGTVTAANASKINDGAAAVVLASGEAVQRLGLRPMAKVVSYAGYAQEPDWFTTAPVEAMKMALGRAGLSAQDISLYEVNEAFANVAMAAERELELNSSHVNVHGGAVALGHPIGASGARILTTLVHALRSHEERYGMASICIGGGEALAVLIERV